MSILGTISKGVKSARTINFAPSGGPNCSKSCPVYDLCYAQNTEQRHDRPTLSPKLVRHYKLGAAAVADQALQELERKRKLPAWLRFSAFGSIPNRLRKKDVESLQRVIDWAVDNEVPAHLPIETHKKADRWSTKLHNVVVRASVGRKWLYHLKAGRTISTVAGKLSDNRVQRNAAALKVARKARANGFKAVVCPAIMASPQKSIKCGQCKACARPDVDLIVYPVHR